jgi:isocitrate dehydrogenase
MSTPTIHYTLTDEAPALATFSLLPILQAFLGAAGVAIETPDLSLAGRILARFPEALTPEQRVPDALAALGELVLQPDAVVVKLPNISASVPQLQEAITELRAQGFAVPEYPAAATDAATKDVRARYDRIKGSAVNPVLRQGNSDRRAPKSVKEFARKYPHSMGRWSADSRTHVATMAAGDFRHNERSATIPAATTVRIEHVAADGEVTVLKPSLALQAGEIVDATFLSVGALRAFLRAEAAAAKQDGLLFSLHLKATMMKVSDPVIFGHAVAVFAGEALERHAEALSSIGVDLNNGLGDLLPRLDRLPEAQAAAIRGDIAAALAAGPELAMVDSDRGVTNLHFPNDVIVDASMPAMIRASGKMYDAAGALRDTKAVLPDSSYAGLYQVVLDDCRAHGAFDPTTMGSVPNVGLMAQEAEEYGSHDKTFVVASAGRVRVVDAAGAPLFEHEVEAGDIWRMCQVKHEPVRDWVRLAVARARASGAPAIFWLDETRPHDAQLIAKVRAFLVDHDVSGLDIRIAAPEQATAMTLERLRAGQDTISVTGNVLRDYLTDLFPILELGTSAKMLSIVPLLAGGGLFETGAGGSAPKHVEQLVEEGHLRWDSLGEFLALAVALEHIAERTGDARIKLLADTLDAANAQVLLQNRSPSRKVGEIDNRGSHAYLALYWAQALAGQSHDAELRARFGPLAEQLAAHEAQIHAELLAAQGAAVDLGGYYRPDPAKAAAVMRPSPTLNRLLATL